MLRIIVAIIFSLIFVVSLADSTQVRTELRALTDEVDKIKRDQINYTIEKDLLKETYSTNYERINTVITFILGIIGVFAFFSIRDINTIKREYQTELEELRKTKTEFEIKSSIFEKDKDKFETDIKQIIQQNEEQNKKIKVLELKEKIPKLIEDNQLYPSLEYCNIGLEISPNDADFLNNKAIISLRLNQYEESLNNFRKALESDPENATVICNYTELLYFMNQIPLAKELEAKHKVIAERESGRLLKYLEVISCYHTLDPDAFKKSIEPFLDFQNIEKTEKYFKLWNLRDSLFFVHHQEDSNKKKTLQYILWFLDGQINTKQLIESLSIETPKNT